MLRWAALALLISGGASAQQLSFVDGSSDFLKAEISRTLGILPVGYLDDAADRIKVRAVPMRNDAFIKSEVLCNPEALKELDLKGSVFGQVKRKGRGYVLTLSARLVELAQEDARLDCSHGSFKNLLTATIIHEFTHVKDNRERISLDPDFQRIVGMKKDIFGRRRLINQNYAVSPDGYEFRNFQESLAVNTEYLVLDPNFQCRKPATATFLAKKLGIALRDTCRKNYEIMTQSAYMEDNYQHTLSIHPSRIYQVHYLFAGKGQAMMSKWGHAMFRLVVCAPHRTTVGPECMNDVSHHVALTYRAYITDMDINYWKGLKGQYPSQLFIMKFHEVQQEYTKFELRDLYSIPLKMTEAQKTEFLDLTVERFWTYQGKYYFIDNNCGTEAQKHLAVVLEEEQARLIRSITPLRIFEDIIKQKNDLATAEVKGKDRIQLIRESLLIPGMFDEYNETYQYLRGQGLFEEKKFKKFLDNHSAKKRTEIYEEFFRNRPVDDQTKVLALKLSHLERYMMSRFVQALPGRTMQKVKKDRSLMAEVVKMGESLKLLSTQPWEVVRSAYGAPVGEEFEVQYPGFVDTRRQDMAATAENQMEALQSLLNKPVFADELSEMEHLKSIRKQMNELIKATSGVVL